jgi:hypothetical protein
MPEKKIDVALQDLEEKYMDSLNENKIKALDMRDDEKYYIEQNPK